MNSSRGAKLIWSIVSILTLVGLTPPQSASADQKLTAKDGAPGDTFGVAVALSGDRAVIGAQLDDDRGPESGSAYIFEKGEGTWEEVAKIIANDGVTASLFGSAVAIDGDRVVVGAPFANGGELNTGAAYVFDLIDGEWTEAAKLIADDGAPFDFFGASVVVIGDTAVVGASFAGGRASESGAVYVYRRIDGQWTQVTKLSAADGAPEDGFGLSVSLSRSGTTLLVGTPHDDDQGTDSGSAYLFVKIENMWQQNQKFLAADGDPDDLYGSAVAMLEGTAVLGAPGDDDRGTDAGAAYIVEKTGGVWQQAAKLTAEFGEALDYFGYSVDISYTRRLVVVGAEGDDDRATDAGAAYIFAPTENSWEQIIKILADDGAAGDHFGFAVAILGDAALVGSPFDDDRGEDSGSAYVIALGELCDPCDANCDGSVDLTDVEPFIVLLLGGPRCDACTGDINDDGSIDLQDVEPFIECLLGG